MSRKKAHWNCSLFSKGSGAGNGNAIRSAQIACRARSSCFLPYLVCKIYTQNNLPIFFFIYHTHNVLHTKMLINSYLRAKLIMKCVNRPKTLGLQNPITPSVFCFFTMKSWVLHVLVPLYNIRQVSNQFAKLEKIELIAPRHRFQMVPGSKG